MTRGNRSWRDGRRRFDLPWKPTGQIDRDVDEELAFHLDRRREELMAGGLTPEAAERRAREEFGDLDAARRDLRRLDRSLERRRRRVLVLDELWRDVTFAARSFRRRPGYFLTTVAVLALGLGATTAVFQVVDLMAFRPILVERPQELVALHNGSAEHPGDYRAFSYPDVVDLAAQTTTLDTVAGYNVTVVGLRQGDATRRVLGALVGETYFRALGVGPSEGRAFTAEESEPDSAAPVAIVSSTLSARLADEGSLLGRSIGVNDLELVVVGVMPPGFTGTTALLAPEIWLPLGLDSSLSRFGTRPRSLSLRDNHALLAFGRRAPGRSLEEVRADLELVGERLSAAHPEEGGAHTIEAMGMTRLSVSTDPESDAVLLAPMFVLMLLGVVVLVIACLNLANMQLARGSARASELALRTALGGGRGRLVRQLVTEGMVLSLVGGVLGLLLAQWVLRLFFGSLGGRLPFDVGLVWSVAPNVRVLAVVALACTLATLVFSLGPAWRVTGGSLIAGLRPDSGGVMSIGALRVAPRQLFLVAQTALSLVLLVAGGLVARGASRAAEVGPGYDVERSVLVDLDPSLAGADEPAGRAAYRRAFEAVRAVPGVEAVGMTSIVPFGSVSSSRRARRAELEDVPENAVTVQVATVGSGYFHALGLEVLQGRDFVASEDDEAPAVPSVLVDRPLADRLWPGESAVGRSLRFSSATRPGEYRVVGVVPGIRQQLWDETPPPHVYLPFGESYSSAMTLHVRMAPGFDPDQAVSQLRRALAQAGPELSVLAARTWQGHRASNVFLWGLQAIGRLLFVFGLLALLLAVVGVYGVHAFLMTRRTREIGVRLALGATREEVLGMVMRESARRTALAVVIGLLLAFGVGRLLASLIRGIEAADPWVMLVSLVVLLVGTAAAAYLPARRATRVSPVVALRCE